TFRVPAQPTGLAVAPDGGTLYVASQTEGRLTALDADSGETRGQLAALRARDVTVSPDGRHVYVSTADAVLVVDAQALGRGQSTPGAAERDASRGVTRAGCCRPTRCGRRSPRAT